MYILTLPYEVCRHKKYLLKTWIHFNIIIFLVQCWIQYFIFFLICMLKYRENRDKHLQITKCFGTCIEITRWRSTATKSCRPFYMGINSRWFSVKYKIANSLLSFIWINERRHFQHLKVVGPCDSSDLKSCII